MPAASSSRPELGDRAVDVALAALAPRVEQLGQLAEALRIEGLEREVLELPLHLPDAEALGQRRVDLERLAGDALLLLGRQAVQRAHVVEPVRELDQDDPDVLGHREQHLADVLGLLLLVAVGAELRELRDAVDELGDLGPEALLDVGQAVFGVLGDVVQQGGLDGDRLDAQVREDLGGRDRVGDVRLAGRPQLAGVGVDGERERGLDRFEVGTRVVLDDRGQQRGLELARDRPPPSSARSWTVPRHSASDGPARPRPRAPWPWPWPEPWRRPWRRA